MPGGSTCPAWIPHELVEACTRNRSGIETITALFTNVATALGVGELVAVAAVFDLIANDCDVVEELKSAARIAAQDARWCSLAAHIADGFGVPFAGLIAQWADAWIPIDDALGAGRAPKSRDVAKAGAALDAVSSQMSPTDARNVAGDVADAVGPLGAAAAQGEAMIDDRIRQARKRHDNHAKQIAVDDARAKIRSKQASEHHKQAAVDAGKAKIRAKQKQVRSSAGGASSAVGMAGVASSPPSEPTLPSAPSKFPSWAKWAGIAAAALGVGAVVVKVVL